MHAVAIKGSAVDLSGGETRILTLADADILGGDGRIAEDGDVLEDHGRSRAETLARKKKCAAARCSGRCACVLQFAYLKASVATSSAQNTQVCSTGAKRTMSGLPVVQAQIVGSDGESDWVARQHSPVLLT